jgi:hypothetical protein
MQGSGLEVYDLRLGFRVRVVRVPHERHPWQYDLYVEAGTAR